MTRAVADTHALIWYLQGDERLSNKALEFFQESERAGGTIYVPSISLIEIIYLGEKGRIPENMLKQFLSSLKAKDSILEVFSLSLPVVLSLEKIPRDIVPDMPDRIIGATALYLGLPLITRDGKIRASGINIIW